MFENLEGGVSWENLILFFLIIIISFLFSEFLYNSLKQAFYLKFSKRVSKTISKLVQYIVLFGGIYIGVYKVLQLEIGTIMASLGILGLVIAFSSQQVVQNILSGIFIFIQKPIRVEDWVEIGTPSTGINRVKEITLMRTILEDTEGKTIYVPNALMLNSKVVNYTKRDFKEVSIQIKIPVFKIENVKKIILEAINQNPKILPNVNRKEKSIVNKLLRLNKNQDISNQFSPKILLTEISDSGMTLSIRVWIREIETKDEIISELLETILTQLKKKQVFKE
ncbi:MAG: mechanosensitive ion channel family protein [Nanoarchaeota archaeon]|nr:mechanosensitive ion channel family protein [Nanoarchaeota archaeon]